MKKCLTIFFLLSVLVFSFNIASAVPPFQSESGTSEGLTLRFPPLSTVKIDTTITAHMHVFNSTNNLLLTNSSVNCSVHLYNSTGFHIVEQLMGFDDNLIDFELEILGGNFSYEGYYSYIIWCNSATAGGFVSGSLQATGNGQPTPSGIVILGFSLLLLLIFISVTVYIVKAVGTIIEGNFDLLDIAFAWGLYFGLLGLDLLANIYLGNLEITNWTSLFVTILAFPMIVVPVLAFFLSLFRAKQKQRKEEAQW